ncbi:hypothetical protein SMB34_18195 [Thalassospira permensis NBRC 106175]|uniref:Uncharacterized protein n=1 Tax=Thalassospira permensis NBRC 106175 TaxID=1353532 RepID=A0ABR4TPD3_9PROT|nr:hypothetical protein SMB34_18195 [Thalassospira permensis NBRC 106175]
MVPRKAFYVLLCIETLLHRKSYLQKTAKMAAILERTSVAPQYTFLVYKNP